MTVKSSIQWDAGRREDSGKTPAEQDSQQHLNAFAQGGSTAIGILMGNYQTFLQRQCRRFTGGNTDDADDLFSLVLIKVYTEHPEQLRKVRHIGAWLRRVAQNKSIDLQRERMAAERRDLGLLHLCDSLGEICLSPVDMLLNRELLAHIQRAFDDLPMRLRLAAHMRFVEDAGYEVISQRLEITQVNARKRVQEARKRMSDNLRRYLAMEGGAQTQSFPRTGLETSAFLDDVHDIDFSKY